MARRAVFQTNLAWWALVAVLAVWIAAVPRAAAQTETGAICVATYADFNGNGIREEAEPPLAGVNVNLSTGGVIIASHVTAEGEDQHCFENLLSGAYTITFTDSPTHRATTANEGTFNLAPGQRLTITDFGAVPIPLVDLPAPEVVVVEAADAADEPLDPSMRLLISGAAALLVMGFMLGVGAILLGAFGLSPRRARRPARGTHGLPPPPAQIEPPGA